VFQDNHTSYKIAIFMAVLVNGATNSTHSAVCRPEPHNRREVSQGWPIPVNNLTLKKRVINKRQGTKKCKVEIDEMPWVFNNVFHFNVTVNPRILSAFLTWTVCLHKPLCRYFVKVIVHTCKDDRQANMTTAYQQISRKRIYSPCTVWT